MWWVSPSHPTSFNKWPLQVLKGTQPCVFMLKRKRRPTPTRGNQSSDSIESASEGYMIVYKASDNRVYKLMPLMGSIISSSAATSFVKLGQINIVIKKKGPNQLASSPRDFFYFKYFKIKWTISNLVFSLKIIFCLEYN